jgi:amino acid transporter
MIATLIVGFLVGAGNAFDYTATLATDLFMVVFIVTNVATIPYFWTRHRAELSWLRHLIVPILGVFAAATRCTSRCCPDTRRRTTGTASRSWPPTPPPSCGGLSTATGSPTCDNGSPTTTFLTSCRASRRHS